MVILASRNIGIDRSDMVGYYTGWHGLPRVVKILLVNGGGGFSCSMLFGVGSCVYERATTVLGPPVD